MNFPKDIPENSVVDASLKTGQTTLTNFIFINRITLSELSGICVKTVFLLAAEFMFVDLTSLKSVRQFVQKFRDRGLPLHVLVNNGRLLSVSLQVHEMLHQIQIFKGLRFLSNTI